MKVLPENQIICGDCLEVMKDWPDNCVDLVLTDPPYSTPVVTAFGRQRIRNIGDLSIQGNFFNLMRERFEKLLKANGRMMCFCDDKLYPILYAVFYAWLSIQLIVWDKIAIGMGKPVRKRHELVIYANRSTWEFEQELETHMPSVVRNNTEVNLIHPAQKPLSLAYRFIAGFSRPNDLILDPFCGSGTTCVAAKMLGRRFIGIDISEKYCEIARQRLEAVDTGVPVKEQRKGQMAMFA